MTVTTDRTPPVPTPASGDGTALPPKDVIIVHVARSLSDGGAVVEAAAGNWVVADEALKHLTYLVAVTTNNDVVGVFDIVGYQAGIEFTQSGAQRVRFDLALSDRTVIAEITGPVQGNTRAYARDLISGDHPLPPMRTTRSGSQPAHGPAVCPACNVAHAGTECW